MRPARRRHCCVAVTSEQVQLVRARQAKHHQKYSSQEIQNPAAGHSCCYVGAAAAQGRMPWLMWRRCRKGTGSGAVVQAYGCAVRCAGMYLLRFVTPEYKTINTAQPGVTSEHSSCCSAGSGGGTSCAEAALPPWINPRWLGKGKQRALREKRKAACKRNETLFA